MTASWREDPAFRMDQLTLPGAFAAVAVSNPSYGKRIMVDVSFIEEQCASHRTQAAEEGPRQALEDRENTKKEQRRQVPGSTAYGTLNN